ncbi:GMC family oxidoreductase [Novosphingobium colocasiae]|uniref:GMC family oxidoreductase n=1 Tax=Novosphingobium colocasiae TaxID=1256513 RepID=UPI0035B08C76
MDFKPDYIIVGAGSAGCVLANRLSADPACKVLLLEAGGSDGGLFYRMPAGFFELMKRGTGNWNFETVPQPGLDGRTIYFPRGKVLGGSSSINGLVVARGNAGDYDRWAQMGNPGWSWADCLPYFRRIESCPASADPATRGHDGPVGVTWTSIDAMNPTSAAFIKGAMAAGHPFNPDMNRGDPSGVAQMQGNYRHGLRQSASACYLKPVLARPNLKVVTGALAAKVLMRSGRATGLAYGRKGRIITVEAARGVVLAGGVVNSPQLLQLSGIGDPADITPHGIAMVHELPEVGRNLKDHLAVTVKQRLTRPYSMLGMLRPLGALKALGQYLLFRSGPTAVGGLEAWAHLMSRPDLEYPDIQIYTVPLMYNDHGRDVIPEEGFQGVMNGSRPHSSGTIRIASADPAAAPLIDPRYLSDPEDLRVLREGIRLTRDIFAQDAYADFRGDEYAPGAACRSDAEIDAYIRATAYTLYHPVGTCRMGTDAGAVVDPDLRVRGVDGLWVVDASVMPDIISGNTNFPTMMIAEKAAEAMIAGERSGAEPGLAPSPAMAL